MKKDLPIYDVYISDDKQGVAMISLVDDPAIKVNWIKLKSHEDLLDLPMTLTDRGICFGCPPNGDGTRVNGEPDGRCKGDGDDKKGGGGRSKAGGKTTGPNNKKLEKILDDGPKAVSVNFQNVTIVSAKELEASKEPYKKFDGSAGKATGVMGTGMNKGYEVYETDKLYAEPLINHGRRDAEYHENKDGEPVYYIKIPGYSRNDGSSKNDGMGEIVKVPDRVEVVSKTGGNANPRNSLQYSWNEHVGSVSFLSVSYGTAHAKYNEHPVNRAARIRRESGLD